MKKLLIAALTLLTLNVCKAEPPINLHMSSSKTFGEDRAVLGAALAITGAMLCTALVLEGNDSYTSAYYNTPSGLYRNEPPFLLQTPKQLFFMVGATISISGVTIIVNNIRNRR
jgi:hypothetical protein